MPRNCIMSINNDLLCPKDCVQPDISPACAGRDVVFRGPWLVCGFCDEEMFRWKDFVDHLKQGCFTPEQEEAMLKAYDSVPYHESVDMYLPHERDEF
jgi:hypothetical protein